MNHSLPSIQPSVYSSDQNDIPDLLADSSMCLRFLYSAHRTGVATAKAGKLGGSALLLGDHPLPTESYINIIGMLIEF